MKTKSILAVTALCLALPAAAGAQGLPEFLTAVGEGIGEGVERSAAKIAASMEEELGVTVSVESARIEESKTLLRLAAVAAAATFALVITDRKSVV